MMSMIIWYDRVSLKSLKLGCAAFVIGAVAGLASPLAAAPVLYGPTAYLQASDSPFSALGFSYFYREDFEDHLLNTPGLSASPGGVASVVFGPSIHDSVDADDGAIDGSGLGGDSYFSPTGAVELTFNAGVLGALPTHAGLVWTDGGSGAPITFQAFDASNNLLGTIIGNNADFSNNGETAEDRFFGISSPGGIARLLISNANGGIEIDHVQYGLLGNGPGVVPLPSAIILFSSGLSAMGLVAWRRKKNGVIAA
jgi:hypothetical protein